MPRDDKSHIFNNANRRESFPRDVSFGTPRTEADVSQKEPKSQSKEVFQEGDTFGTSISSIISETYRNVDPSEDTVGCQAAACDSSGAPAKVDKGVCLQLDARSTSWTPSKTFSQGTSYKSSYTKANSDCKAAPAVSAQLDCRSNSIENLKTSARKVVKQLMPSQILEHYPPVLRSNLTGRYMVLFPYDLFIKLYNYKEELHPCGLKNCGNRYAIETMQSVCLKEAGADVVDPLAEETTLIHLMFGGYLISKVKCMRCRVKSERRDRMMDLTVEIPGDIGTLEEALARYTATEILDGENKYNCSRYQIWEAQQGLLLSSFLINICPKKLDSLRNF